MKSYLILVEEKCQECNGKGSVRYERLGLAEACQICGGKSVLTEKVPIDEVWREVLPEIAEILKQN